MDVRIRLKVSPVKLVPWVAMMRKANPNLLRVLLALFVLASASYWFAGLLDNWEMGRHATRHVVAPFEYDADTALVTSVRVEAKEKGIAPGDKITGLNGAPYTGRAQWATIITTAQPGDLVDVEFIHSGRADEASITLAQHAPLNPGVARWAVLLSFVVLAGLLPLACLLIGYWIVALKPTDSNAWLLLVLLTLPSVVVVNEGLASGAALALRVSWYNVMQLLAFPALLLFGISFPERSRLDKKAPWIKWAILVPYFAALVPLWAAVYMDYFDGPLGATWLKAGNVLGNVLFPALLLACIAMYLIFTVDKLRSASTADARRRLRVMVLGMAIGLGSLVTVVLLDKFGLIDRNTPSGFWIPVVSAIIFMAAPLSLAYVVLVQRAMDVHVIVRMGARYAMARAVLMAVQAALILIAVWLLIFPALHQRQPGASVLAEVLIFLGLVVVLRVGVQKRAQGWLDRRFFREAYDAEVVLSELADEVRRFTETGPLLETVVRRVSETLHVDQIAVMLRSNESFHLAQAIGVPIDGAVMLTAQASSVRYLSATNEPARLYRDDPDAWYLMAGLSERQVLDNMNAELLLPLPGRNRLMGVVALGPKRSEAAYTRADLQMLQTVATQTGLALEITQLAHSLASEAAQRERANREIEIAREVQERLFPQEMPDIQGATIAGHCRPALGVGGDYYDVFRLEDGRLGLAIGDVSGKGIAAALLMASLRASLRGISLDNPRDFAKLMDKVNRLVYESSAANRYATFFFAAYDASTRRLDCVNAGHNPPMVLRCGTSNGSPDVLRLEADGPVVGLLPGAPYTEQTVELRPGDLLVMFTDGISEAMTSDDEEWGEDRLISSAHLCRDKTAQAALKDLFRDVDAFTAGAAQHDDMSLLVLKLE
ncbi:MAG TPA: SpoIIE family protein phosphatase [Acidobacteriaceae bacterium]|nr:SpoIIE family protein phosphatase [Acidobacteriaceae bacterium]